MNIRFAIASFSVLFGLAQLWSWLKQFSLETPIVVIGGLFLALASNFDRRATFPFDRLHQWLNPIKSTEWQTTRPDTE
jgi:hypothetical protein